MTSPLSHFHCYRMDSCLLWGVAIVPSLITLFSKLGIDQQYAIRLEKEVICSSYNYPLYGAY
jgi:hypothetical protein